MKPIKIGIITGEASGDLLGASLMKTLSEHQSIQVSGIGGAQMVAAGCHNLYDAERLSVMGIVEPLFRLRELFSIRKNIIHHFLKNPPDVFIGIDAPDFNLGVELKLRAAKIPVIHYVSPSVWAWRKNRVHKIRKATDLVLTLLPFEKQFYDAHQVPATFVGHPLADQIPLEIDQTAARHALGLNQYSDIIALLPGSRYHEIYHMGPTFIQAAKICFKANPNLRFITSGANQERLNQFKALVTQLAPELPIDYFLQQSHPVMAAADMALVGSGTATLETMLHKRPMVIVYKTSFLTYQIAKWLVDVPFIGLPNLIANERLVPEYIQHAATPEALAKELLNYLNHPEKRTALADRFKSIHETLRCEGSQRAAKAVMDILKK